MRSHRATILRGNATRPPTPAQRWARSPIMFSNVSPSAPSARARARLARGTPTRSRRGDGFGTVAAMVIVMWVVEVVDAIDKYRLNTDGIRPRQLSGLAGIVFAPFLHASFTHLMSNTVPFVVLGLAIAFEGAARVLAVTAIVGLVAGLGTWLVAPAGSVTFGASGIVIGYATYLIARGLFSRRLVQLAIGVAVGVLFGSVLLSSLVPHAGISWQDHLFGGIGGLLAARVLADAQRRRRSGPLVPA
jgi:membrane associated rhomboid family serine protease